MSKDDCAHPMPRWQTIWCLGIVVCFIALGGRLYYIHAYMAEELTDYQLAQQTRRLMIPAQRGAILDRRGRLLAGTQMKPSVFVDPQMAPPSHAIASQLAPILGKSPTELQAVIDKRSETRFVWLARDVSAPEAEAIQALKLPGVRTVHEPQRYYPNGTRLSHVLGFVGSDHTGLEGAEKQFDALLSGTAGRYEVLCDMRRRPVWSKASQFTKPVDGNHVVLAVDLVIQTFLEDAVSGAVEHFEAESGCGVVIHPPTGEVLAMCSVPEFDPNRYQAFPPDVRRNRCLTDPVEPGSCFKPFIMAAALSEGTARLDEMIDCGPGVKYFGGRRLRDTHARGVISFEDVMVVSSNIGMGVVATRMGNPLLHKYISAFGFGAKTGIDLPGEDAGILLPVRKWTSYSTTSVSMGQELAVTPMQIATAFAALCNEGMVHKPQILRNILSPEGRLIEEVPCPDVTQRAIAPNVARRVSQRVLVKMVNESHHKVKLDHYQVLGKTGTAQIPRQGQRGYEPDAYVSSFLGAAPARDPLLAVVVMIRKPNKRLGYYGGTVAGPAVRDVLAKTLAYWDVPHDPPMLHLASHDH